MSAVIQFSEAGRQSGDRPLRIALAGNPNCGKTTVFNAYTGARQHVGNYPGVTVDRKEGPVRHGQENVTLVDLPGTYSLTAYSQEEIVARAELASGNVQAVINVVDASALERNLLLTVQMLEMGLPVVLACNMMDEARKAGIHIDIDRLSHMLGIPVVSTVARNGEGLKEAMSEAVRLAKAGERHVLEVNYGADVNEGIMAMQAIIEREKLLPKYAARWIAVKLMEGDPELRQELRAANATAAQEMEGICRRVADHIRTAHNVSMESHITDARYGFIRGLLRDGVIRQDAGKDRLALSDKLDKVLTNAFFGPLIMLVVLYAVFQITIEIGAYPQGWVEDACGALGELFAGIIPEGDLQSLVVDGIIGGVGGVLSFAPLIVIMFALIAFMEDSGYMARIAYMMDRVFRAFGLHGASVMPYVISGGIAGGCAIPGAMATRTLRSPKEKLATLLTLPYMSCGAKLPVFLLLAAAFFGSQAPTVMVLIMLSGWVFALLVARLLRSTIIRGEATPFVMELPPYRLPTLFSVLMHCWERTWMYVKKAGTVILAISIIIWAGLTYPKLSDEEAAAFDARIEALNAQREALPEGDAARAALEEQVTRLEEEKGAAELAHSFAGRLGKLIEPVTAPAGFEWRTDIALLAGIAAKEAVVSTLGTAYSLGDVDPEDATPLESLLQATPGWSKATALSLMLFVLLYSPCFVSLVVIQREAGGWRWLFFSLFFNTALAYVVAVAAYQIGLVVWN
ncbi:ferrous iron transport protein B [uncultured Desulfovibrio sp.]|uniref:ferrous iron transport protein B n=2 Tax=uncultured Desulfovibrio sp. TaxID=167968 RepID=UPI0025DA4D6A|nr:ferrous iron transport protein B [uncultured Desulfovibrio sp.]